MRYLIMPAVISAVSLVAFTAAPLGARPATLAYPHRADGATHVSAQWQLPEFVVEADAPPTETLADALDAAYRSAPALQIRRYELRASDEDYAQALTELRPTAQLQITGTYSKTVPGGTTQAARPLADRLNSPIITSNRLGAELIVDQPLYTSGKVAADTRAAVGVIEAGRAQLRGTEGDLFLQVITAYVDIGRDSRTLALRRASLRQFAATLAEVTARQEAGELTRTDIAQAQTQMETARTFENVAEQQMEQDRAAYAALVGHDAGVLAAEPPLPQLPETIDAAFDIAQRLNPELARAIAAERASRARIDAAAAQGGPRLSLRGTASLTGQAAPFYLRNEDQGVTGQAVLTIPLTNGGRVGSLVAQARDRNDADRIRIEAARRSMIQQVVNAWNGVATAQRNARIQTAQLAAARTLDEGTFEEYRAGLRSTFDVLYAHGSLRDAEIALVNSNHDLYLAEAALLRHIGMLEARTILDSTPLYDVEENTRHAAGRGAMPWDPLVRSLDRVGVPKPKQGGLEQPALPRTPPAMPPAGPMADVPPISSSPNVPLPGTVGVPIQPSRISRP